MQWAGEMHRLRRFGKNWKELPIISVEVIEEVVFQPFIGQCLRDLICVSVEANVGCAPLGTWVMYSINVLYAHSLENFWPMSFPFRVSKPIPHSPHKTIE